MLVFRASSAGRCLASLVLGQLHPDRMRITDSKVLKFLEDGHKYQAEVSERLQGEGVEIKDVESEVLLPSPEGSFVFVGHIDGDLPEEKAVLEIKAITPHWFSSLKKGKDWRKLYPQYQGQQQVYIRGKARDKSLMVFVNRQTHEMLGGLELEAEGYTYRSDMVEDLDDTLWEEVYTRHLTAVNHVYLGHVPEYCDLSYYCWDCGRDIIRKETN